MTKTGLLKIIRKHCLWCSCDSAQEIKNCKIKDCLLRPYRFGKDPERRILSDVEKQRRVNVLKKARELKNSVSQQQKITK